MTEVNSRLVCADKQYKPAFIFYCTLGDFSMKRLKRILAAFLALMIIYGMLPGGKLDVYADTLTVNVTAQSFENDVLTIRWDSLPGTKSIVVLYHTPNSTDDPQTRTIEQDQTTNTVTVNGLTSDYIYDFEVQVYDAAGGAGNMIGRGFLYYLPKITFIGDQLVQGSTVIAGGGVETGTRPGLNLRWKMPKVYNEVDKFVFANTALDIMEARLRSFYPDRNVDSLGFRINISTNYSLLNSGSSQASIIIRENAGNYIANVSGNTTETAQVENIMDGLGVWTGYMNINLVGRSSITADPVPSDPVVAKELLDPDILPGTVYYMNIKPVFEDRTVPADPLIVNAISVGKPADQNGSLLAGTLPYVFTAIRFQLTKDAANNLYIKIYKINQGSLDLPRLFYEVQASDDPSVTGDWTVKKTMDDTYFVGDYAMTVISGINPNNTVYYKIVVKSDSPTDRLESPKLPYTLSVDTSKPPVPMNIRIDKKTFVTGVVNGTTEKSTDVVISWDKPLNWDDIKNNTDPNEDIVYHFMLSTAQTDLDIDPDPPLIAEGKSYGNFDINYRLVKYISSKQLQEEGTRLSFELKGFDSLFVGQHWTTADGIVDENIPHTPGYPTFLLPNTVYYLQMYTTKDPDRGTADTEKMSDKSIITSFTTLSGIERDVPIIKNFIVNDNDFDMVPGPSGADIPSNYVELQFEKPDIEWKYFTSNLAGNADYYDIYMSTEPIPERFVIIGSTDPAKVVDGIPFTGVAGNSKFVRGLVQDFKHGTAAYTVFGLKLRPNTTYYFYIVTRLVMPGTGEKISFPTSYLTVTTVPAITGEPDPTQKPIAPADFAIAEDENGNQLITGTSAVFKWSRRESGVKYQIICTTARVAVNALESDYMNDAYYMSFIEEYDMLDGMDDGKVFLDPASITLPSGFEYDPLSNTYTYMTDGWLTPNKLYYFSLKAIYTVDGRESVWVSIPVTTALIEAPTMLEAINDCELAVFWQDTDAILTAEDFKIFIKGPSDTTYKALPRSNATVVKDGTWYYGRIYGLKDNTAYGIRVYKGADSSILVHETTGRFTRDSYHQTEIKWKGRSGYSYEIALKAADDDDYTVLSTSDLENYTDKDGHTAPYYIEKSIQTAGTEYSYYYARIKTAAVTLADGTIVHRPLRSNTKYYIKVRAVKEVPSKYAGPVETRTEYSREDYDNKDREKQQEAVFLDRISKLEEGPYWKLSMGRGAVMKILLKADVVSNGIENSGNQSYLIDISQLSVNIDTDVILIPLSIVEKINSLRKSLVIRLREADYTIKPGTINTEGRSDIKALKNRADVKNILLEVAVSRLVKLPTGTPSGMQAASKCNQLTIQAVGTGKTDEQISKMIHDRLYDSNTGLVSQKLNILLGTGYVGNSADVLNDLVTQLAGLIENELSDYIQISVESMKVYGATAEIKSFDSAAQARLYSNGVQGAKVPYVQYTGSTAWKKIERSNTTAGSVAFDIMGSGKIVLLAGQQQASDLTPGYWAYREIHSFTEKYDLSDVFDGMPASFNPEDLVTGKEMVLLYEKVTGRIYEGAGTDIKQKAKALGIDIYINVNGLMGNLRRQEAAAVIIKAYGLKTGIDPKNYLASSNIEIKDESDIGARYYQFVIMAVDTGVMSLDAGGNFLPKEAMSRSEVVAALTRMLELAGEI